MEQPFVVLKNVIAIFVLGGFDDKRLVYCSSILKLSMKIQMTWDTLILKDSNNMISRNFSTYCKIDGMIYIFGGSNKESVKTDTILEVDIFSKCVTEMTKNLNNPSKFTIQNSLSYMNSYYIFDDENKTNCYKFDKHINLDILQ